MRQHPTTDELAGLLVKARIVHPDAVEDPEGFDDGKTLDSIGKVAEELRKQEESEQPAWLCEALNSGDGTYKP